MKKQSPFVKSKCYGEKCEWGLTSLKDAWHFFHIFCSLAKILFLVWMNIVQTATYQQHVPSTPIFHVSRNVPICIDHCTFWEHYNMSITHCMVCRNLIFCKTYCVIGGALNITAKRRTTTLLQTGMLHVERIALYFVGILFLERSNVFSWRNIYNI